MQNIKIGQGAEEYKTPWTLGEYRKRTRRFRVAAREILSASGAMLCGVQSNFQKELLML